MPRLFGPKNGSYPVTEERELATRLMQISLEVDDYIYKHKPISESDAEMYIKEVSSYELKCCKDVRSLQVIDKLRRCMKDIIAEHQELKSKLTSNNDTNVKEVNTQGMPTSPVYSLPDEDKFQHAQNYLVDDVSYIEVTETNVNEIDIIDLCSNDTNDKLENSSQTYQTNLVVNGDTEQVISNSSLKDSDDLQLSETVVENCSLSILESYANTDKLRDSNIASSQAKEVNRAISDDKINEMTTEDNLEVTKTNSFPIHGIHKPVPFKAPHSTQNVCIVNCKTGNTKTKVKRKTTHKKKTDTYVKENVKTKKTRNKSVKNKESAIKCVENSADANAICCNNKNNEAAANLYDPNISKHVAGKSLAHIYTQSIENDLSWVENIRYVREVSADEIDPKLTDLDQCFWDNYALPDCWDNQDFVYTS